MNLTCPAIGLGHVCGAGFAVFLSAVLCPLVARGQLASSGYPVSNPDWEILVTDYGYADLALDRRAGFVGREYLSGEWAAAVLYSGGQNPTNAIWFQPQWFFPDWVSDSNFGVETPFGSTGTNNASGFTAYRSVITNGNLRITLTYEMLDTATGIAQGTAPKSAGGAGSSLLSNRYVFRQTYRITNISGGTLTNIRLFQFLHGLEMGTSLYDDRLYGGAMSAYRYDITQQGQSYGFDSRTGEIVRHSDTLTFHAQMTPSAWEAGYYGKRGVDSHVVGKPSTGVHLKVEANNLNTNIDYFAPAETRWVSGAQRFELGSLSAGGSVTLDVLLSLQTSYVVAFPGVNVVIRGLHKTTTNTFIIDFQEMIGGPVGFTLLRSTNVNLTPVSAWEQVPIPYFINVPQPGWRRYVAPVDPALPRCFYLIQPFIKN